MGEWGGSSGAGDENQTNLTGQVAFNVDSSIANDASQLIEPAQAGYPIDLRDEESNGGHTIERHVGKSFEYLIRRSQSSRFEIGPFQIWKDRVGSFPSAEAAGKVINSTLARNWSLVEKVARGDISRIAIDALFGAPTGYESYAATFHSKIIIRDTFWVRVYIRHDRQSPRGFRIVTGFPFNK